MMPKKGGCRKWPCKWLSVERLKGAVGIIDLMNKGCNESLFASV